MRRIVLLMCALSFFGLVVPACGALEGAVDNLARLEYCGSTNCCNGDLGCDKGEHCIGAKPDGGTGVCVSDEQCENEGFQPLKGECLYGGNCCSGKCSGTCVDCPIAPPGQPLQPCTPAGCKAGVCIE